MSAMAGECRLLIVVRHELSLEQYQWFTQKFGYSRTRAVAGKTILPTTAVAGNNFVT
jgi:hypothetical protein